MNKTSQAAVEFLTTYVWAFFVIGLTIGALYYFGIFDFSKYLPQKCTFPSQFKCLDFSLNPSQVKFKLTNNLGEDITVTDLEITNEASNPIVCTLVTPAPQFDWTHATDKDITFSSCSGGAYISDTRAELKITMKYFAQNTPSHPIHLVTGKINGKVTST